jgi:hypothetical protein
VIVVHREQLIGQLIGDAEELQQAHDLVVEVDGPRQRVDLAEALEHHDLVSGAAEQGGQSLADRAIADDRHVDVVIVVAHAVKHMPERPRG